MSNLAQARVEDSLALDREHAGQVKPMPPGPSILWRFTGAESPIRRLRCLPSLTAAPRFWKPTLSRCSPLFQTPEPPPPTP